MKDVAKRLETDKIEFNTIYGKSDHLANQYLKWYPSDTHELFDRNMQDPILAAKLHDLGWTRDSIMYRFNNHGFRTDDDWEIGEQEPGDVFLGCSVTLGVGLNIEDTWAHRISSRLGNGRFYNLAQVGTGLETQYRMLRSWAPLLRPRRIFTIGAFEPRREFLGDKGDRFMFAPMTVNVDNTGVAPFIFSEKETTISAIRTMDSLKQVAAECNSELWYPGLENLIKSWKTAPKSGMCARDLIHAGKDYHRSLSMTLENWKRLV